jgi:hypothetical protein
MQPDTDLIQRFFVSTVVYTTLPGPTRARQPRPYRYRLTYRNPEPGTPGCTLLWEVEGGRLPYQIALERQDSGLLRWHCTCADAVYRGEDDERHLCKHVRGLRGFGRPAGRGPCPVEGRNSAP